MEVASVSEQGARLEMEDTHYLDTDFGRKGWLFGGVYDGHGGNFAALFTAEQMHRVFLNKILTSIPPQQAFIESYEEISGKMKYQNSGTTAVNVLIDGNKTYTANAGDARAIVITTETVIQLSVDHRVDNPEEKHRIESMGGKIRYPYVMRGYSGLMPTRTIGDEYFRTVGIIATPSVSEYRISKNDLVLIAACDGLFDFMSNEEVAEFARRTTKPESLLEILKKEVLFNRGGTDNLTIIAVKLF
jgi:serine/threonine protein phosphatase PrpC